jgi:excisionase family DNA binding protein
MRRETMTELPNKELLRVDEVAVYFQLTVKTIYKWIDEGKLEAIQIEGSRVLRIPRKNVLEIIQSTLK